MNVKWLSNNQGINHELPKRGPGHKSSAAKIQSIQKCKLDFNSSEFWFKILKINKSIQIYFFPAGSLSS